MSRIVKAGSTSNIIGDIFIQDSSSTTGTGLTGLVYNTGGLTCYYHRDIDSSATAVTLANMTLGTFASGGFKAVDGTNCPGLYQFCPPDAAVATGAKSVTFFFKGATNMSPTAVQVLLSAFDVQSATVTVGTNNDKTGYTASTVSDKTGYSLSQSFPSNFASQAIDSSGRVQVQYGTSTGQVNLSAGNLAGAVPSVTGNVGGNVVGSVASVTSGVTVTTNNDKTGYSLTVTPPTAAQVATQVWQDLTAGSDFTTTGSIGKLLHDDIDATISSRSTFAGGSVASVTGDVGGNVVGSVGSVTGGVTVTTNNDKTDYTLASDGVDNVSIENEMNLRQAISIISSVLAGVLSGASGTSITIKAANDNSTTRVQATVDANGNRSALTLTLP